MLYQPSYPSPYLSDVDGGKANVFSCYINADGGTTVTSYQYKITTYSGTNVYTSAVISISPLYAGDTLAFTVPSTIGLVNGSDYLWNITLYTEIPDIWVTYGTLQAFDSSTITLRPNQFVQVGMFVQVGNQKSRIAKLESVDNGLKATITPAMTNVAVGDPYNVYNNNVTSTDYYFRARTTPTLILNTIPESVTSKSYTFSATYTQAENVGFKYFEWTIYDVGGNVIDQSGERNSGAITYTFDGFINGSTYGVGLTLENQDGEVLSVTPKYFMVEYALPELDNAPTASVNCENDSVELIWSPLLINSGSAVADEGSTVQYDILENEPYIGGSSVRIGKGTKLEWYIGSEQTPIYAPYESTTFFNWHTTDTNFEGLIYKQEGEYIELIAMSATPPVTSSAGDKYYNTSTKLIYTATADNVWSSSGDTPRDDVVYTQTTTGFNYIWNGDDMEVTDYDPPSYKISYQDGAFYYDIENGEISIHDKIVKRVTGQEWLLQPSSSLLTDDYIWKDSADWNDEYYWAEITEPYITKYWFKFTLLPTTIQIQELEITATTWNDLKRYTLDEVRQYTWNQLRYNKI